MSSVAFLLSRSSRIGGFTTDPTEGSYSAFTDTQLSLRGLLLRALLLREAEERRGAPKWLMLPGVKNPRDATDLWAYMLTRRKIQQSLTCWFWRQSEISSNRYCLSQNFCKIHLSHSLWEGKHSLACITCQIVIIINTIIHSRPYMFSFASDN